MKLEKTTIGPCMVTHDFRSSACGSGWSTQFTDPNIKCAFRHCRNKKRQTQIDGAHVHDKNKIHYVIPLCAEKHHNRNWNGKTIHIIKTEALIVDDECIKRMEN